MQHRRRCRNDLTKVIIEKAPALPYNLTDVAPPDTMWKASATAPALPVSLVEDDDEAAPAVSWLAASAPAMPIMPGPFNDEETEAVFEPELADTDPRQPAPLATIAESSPAWAFKASSSAECAPHLPAELGPEGQISSNSGATWSFHRRAPLYPEGSLPDPHTNTQSSHEPAVPGLASPKGLCRIKISKATLVG